MTRAILPLCALVLPFLACAHATPPVWVVAGSGARIEAGERFLFGVGRVARVRDPSQARAVADNRARREVLRLLRSGRAGRLTVGEVSGIRIRDRWRAADGTLFSLAVYGG
jgi:hypothetical protein